MAERRFRIYNMGNWKEATFIIGENDWDKEISKMLLGSDCEQYYSSEDFVETPPYIITIWKENSTWKDDINTISEKFLVSFEGEIGWLEYIVVEGGLPSLLSLLNLFRGFEDLFKGKTFKE